MIEIFTAVVYTRVGNSPVKLAVKLPGGFPHTPADILAVALTSVG